MPHQMTDATFLQEQRDNRYAPRVKEINELVDSIQDPARGLWAPHVAPHYGGRDAVVLFLMASPGAGPNDQDGGGGSGFLSSENRDDAAERLSRLMTTVGLRPRDCVSWNAYPWVLTGGDEPNPEQIRKGLKPLLRLLPLLERLQVVVLLGKAAQRSWELVSAANPPIAERITHVPTHSTGPRAFLQQREVREAEQLKAFKRAADRVGAKPPAL